MPKLAKKPAQPPGPGTPNKIDNSVFHPLYPAAVAPDFATLGYAVALADLAAARGMTVQGVCEFPDELRKAGLPYPLPAGVAHAAHRIDRDRTDGMLWRCHGRRVGEPVPEIPRAEAQRRMDTKQTERKTGVHVTTAPVAEDLL